MPILFVIVLIVAAMLVRIAPGTAGLCHAAITSFVKMVLVVWLFAIYSSAIWSSRQNFCVQMSGLIQELQQRMTAGASAQREGTLDRTAAGEAARDQPDQSRRRSML